MPVDGIRVLLAVVLLAGGVSAGEPATAMLGVALVVVGAPTLLALHRRGSRRLRRGIHAAQLSLDLVLAATAVAVLTPIRPSWPILLVPVCEAVRRFRAPVVAVTLVVGIALVETFVPAARMPSEIVDVVAIMVVTAAIAVIGEQNTRRFAALRRAQRRYDHRAELLSVLADASRTVATLDPARVLASVAEATRRLGFDMAEIVVSRDGTLVPVVQDSWPEHHPTSGHPDDRGAAGRAYTTGELVVVDDYQQWEHALPIHLRTGIVRSAIAAPVRSGRRTVAVLAAANHEPRAVTEEQRECVELLAVQAGIALRNAEMYDHGQRLQRELEHQARHDVLTGVANRALLVEKLDERMRVPLSQRSPLTVLFVDLDDFKAVNDHYGHQVGDAALVEIAQRLTRVVRDEDVVVRYGGDEFIVLLDVTSEEVAVVAARMHEALAAPIEVGDTSIRVGASIGRARERAGDDADSLLRRADDAMYAVKRGDDATRRPPRAATR